MTLAPKVLIVGCGMTGSSVFHYLTRLFNTPAECVTIWEKAAEVGGRMRSASFQGSHCDLGAQYITQTKPDYDDIYSHLVSNNIFNKLAVDIDGMKPDALLKNHYVSSRGLSTVIQHLATNARIRNSISLQSLHVLPSGQVEARGSLPGQSNAAVKEAFDIVVITTPTPSLSILRSSLESINRADANEFFEKLAAVRYSSRYAMAVFYEASVTASLTNVPWGAKYVSDNDVIRYVSIESRKHSGSVCASAPTPLSILVHTSVPFGLENESKSTQEIEGILMSNLGKVLPALAGLTPLHRELVHWKESQVSKGLVWKDSQGSAAFATDTISSGQLSKGVLLAGDYFTESNFEGCLASARAAATTVAKALGSS